MVPEVASGLLRLQCVAPGSEPIEQRTYRTGTPWVCSVLMDGAEEEVADHLYQRDVGSGNRVERDCDCSSFFW